MHGFNEVDIFVCQNAKDKIWNFEYIDLSLMLCSNISNQHNSEDTIGLNNGVLAIQKKVRKRHANKYNQRLDRRLYCICSNHD